jgi:hypothetical protein
VDSSSNVYVIGYANGTATVIAATAGTGGNLNGTDIAIANAGSTDAFIVKYASDGLPLWVRRIASISNDQGMGISADSSGNVYVTGYCTGTGTVFAATAGTGGNLNGTDIAIANTGSQDAFIVKYASDGLPIWVRRIAGTSNDQGLGISTDSSSNVYVTGYCTGTGTVFAADGTTAAFTLANAGGEDGFIVKYDTSGTPLWYTLIAGTGADRGQGISTDSSGNVYATGYYTGNVVVRSAGL